MKVLAPSHSQLETALERVGRILSRQYHIAVRCKGHECKTDGRTIWLPALPEDLSPRAWSLVRGELDHETAHILFSDFTGRMKTFRQTWGDFGFDLLNIVEDVRVNYRMQEEYPGSRQNLLSSIDVIAQSHPIAAMPLPARFLCGLFLAGMDLPYDRYGADAIYFVEQFLPEARQFKQLQSTEEACDMAERILQRLRSSSLPHSPSARSGPSGSPRSDNRGSAPSASASSGPGSGPAPSGSYAAYGPAEAQEESQVNAPKSSGKENPATPASVPPMEKEPGPVSPESVSPSVQPNDSPTGHRAETAGAPETTSSIVPPATEMKTDAYSSAAHPFELRTAVTQEMGAAAPSGGKEGYRVYDLARDTLQTAEPQDQGETYRRLMQTVRPRIAALRQPLIRTLRAREARFWIGEQEEGQVDARRLHTLVQRGASAVFKRPQECETDAVAVTLLIDLSSSMLGPKMWLAQETALLFAETLQRLAVPSEIVGFTTENPNRCLKALLQETGLTLEELCQEYSRFVPVRCTLFKSFAEPFKVLRTRISDMQARHYTPLGDALWLAAKRLHLRPEPRKVILLLTDGEPYDGNTLQEEAMIQRLQNILQKIEAAGMECVAIGLQTDAVRKYFLDSVVVHNLEELPRKFYRKFAQLLQRIRKKP